MMVQMAFRQQSSWSRRDLCPVIDMHTIKPLDTEIL